MIDRFYLEPYESYEFLTDNQYVVIIALESLEVYKDDKKLATLHWLENFSCPANTGSYVIRALDRAVNVLLVRYILV